MSFHFDFSGSFSSDVGGMYSSSYGGDYMTRGSNVWNVFFFLVAGYFVSRISLILMKFPLASDRWVAARTPQCTLDVVWGAAVIWAVVGLDHTIDVSQTALWLFHSCHDYFFSSFFFFYFPSHSFYVGDLFFPRRMPLFFSKKSDWWKWNNMVTSYLFMEQSWYDKEAPCRMWTMFGSFCLICLQFWEGKFIKINSL